MKRLAGTIAVVLLLIPALAGAWGPDGHKTVGLIAQRLIAGSHAAIQVQQILGSIAMDDAAVWADCAKGIDPKQDYTYPKEGIFPECAVFETQGLEAEMGDYVRLNDVNCDRKPAEESCHKQYHYADIAIQRDHYDASYHGARSDDVVAAIVAAVHRLREEPVPPPFVFETGYKGKREALFLLMHLVGDVHQPLHVAAIYLDATGMRVDPDTGPFDPAVETRGGNGILVGTGTKAKNLHATWDAIPATLLDSHVGRTWLRQARAITPTPGSVYDWPRTWASETVLSGQDAFEALEFGEEKSGKWHVTLPEDYGDEMSYIKQQQLTRAGGRLAQLLRAIWP